MLEPHITHMKLSHCEVAGKDVLTSKNHVFFITSGYHKLKAVSRIWHSWTLQNLHRRVHIKEQHISVDTSFIWYWTTILHENKVGSFIFEESRERFENVKKNEQW